MINIQNKKKLFKVHSSKSMLPTLNFNTGLKNNGTDQSVN